MRTAGNGEEVAAAVVVAPSSCWRRFRLNGIRPAKSLLASSADIAGDWWFYLSVRDAYEDELFDRFELPLLVFACVSAFMGLVLVVSLYWNHVAVCRTCERNQIARLKYAPFGAWLKRTLAMEILVESIPQFVLTIMISVRRGVVTPQAVFNFTTSGANFALNLLDMIELEEGDGGDEAEVLVGAGNEADANGGENSGNIVTSVASRAL